MQKKLPSRKVCLSWLNEFKMPANILAHVKQVNRIAVFIAKKYAQKGIPVDVDLVDCASLLHDIDKHLTLENGKHGSMGKEILQKKCFPEIAEFCVTHLLTFVLEKELPSLEHKIVFYADKRANGDKIVSIDERFDYFAKRYGSKSPQALERIMKTKPICLKLEKELLLPIGVFAELKELTKKVPEKTMQMPAQKSSAPAKVKASKRPKKRYLLFEIKSKEFLGFEFVKRSLVLALRGFFGEGFDSMRIWVIFFDERKSAGIVRFSHRSQKEVAVFLNSLDSIGGKKALVKTVLSSGSIKKLKQKISAM